MHTGEIQFLLNIFLNFKKRQHSIYSFIRNDVLYDRLYNLQLNMSLNKNNMFFNRLRKLILSHNLKQFSLFLECLTLPEKYYILDEQNESKIIRLLNENEWGKGKQFFQMFMQRIKSNK